MAYMSGPNCTGDTSEQLISMFCIWACFTLSVQTHTHTVIHTGLSEVSNSSKLSNDE